MNNFFNSYTFKYCSLIGKIETFLLIFTPIIIILAPILYIISLAPNPEGLLGILLMFFFMIKAPLQWFNTCGYNIIMVEIIIALILGLLSVIAILIDIIRCFIIKKTNPKTVINTSILSIISFVLFVIFTFFSIFYYMKYGISFKDTGILF